MRQHATPLLLGADGVRHLTPLALGAGPEQISEAALQQLIHDHPGCLPIAEVDPLFANPVPICTELNTTAGPVDNLLVTASGLPVLVECKLWRNPQARREVVGQLLDYAKELSRWSSSDLQREASQRTGRAGNVVLDLVRAAGHKVDETDFNDALTLNLRRGRFLLLIVGDGIREGVEAIAEYLQAHAGLHFTLGLVELPMFALPGGERLVAPRVLARTTLVTREVVLTPEGTTLREDAAVDPPEPEDEDAERRRAVLAAVVDGFRFSDPEQPAPKPTPKGYLYCYLPSPGNSCWITIGVRKGETSVWVASRKGTIGDRALSALATDSHIAPALGGGTRLHESPPGRFWLKDQVGVDPFGSSDDRRRAVVWLRERLDTFVNVLRPAVRAAVADLAQE